MREWCMMNHTNAALNRDNIRVSLIIEVRIGVPCSHEKLFAVANHSIMSYFHAPYISERIASRTSNVLWESRSA
jgi:hypothetical protein